MARLEIVLLKLKSKINRWKFLVPFVQHSYIGENKYWIQIYNQVNTPYSFKTIILQQVDKNEKTIKFQIIKVLTIILSKLTSNQVSNTTNIQITRISLNPIIHKLAISILKAESWRLWSHSIPSRITMPLQFNRPQHSTVNNM